MLYRILIFRCRRIWHHHPLGQVAGFHRAVPSTALDKAVCNFLMYYIHFPEKVNTFFDFYFPEMFTIPL